MDDRIIINRSENKLEIVVKSYKEVAKQRTLLMWIILFSICGIAILAQFLFDYSKSYQLFFIVYLAFWFYFEFKVVYAFRWRNAGVEKIILTKDETLLVKEIGKRGVTDSFTNTDISELALFEPSVPNFVKAMNDSYWNINKYSLAFKNSEKLIPFAIDLDKNQAKKVLKEIQSFLKMVS